MTRNPKDLATRQAEAKRSAARQAGYCGLDHPTTPAFCTRPPGHSGPHRDYYYGRKSPVDAVGTEWSE